MSRRDTTADEPLQRVLARLRYHGSYVAADSRRFNRWTAACPVCRTEGLTLEIIERGRGGTVELRCWHGCKRETIIRTLAAEPAELRIAEALALAEEAKSIAERAIQLVVKQAGATS